jgi:heme A synthase
MIAMLAYKAWRHFRENRALVRTSVGALGLIIVQAALGGLTVERGLEDELVAIHLGVAMIQIALVLLIARLALPVEATRGGEHLGTTRAMRVLAVSATVAALATIVAGGYIAGTEKNGSPDEPRAIGAHSACGSDFPSCGGELWPYGRSRAVDIHLTHRAFMYLTVALVVALFVVALRQRRRLDPEAARRLTRGARASLGVLATQVLLGAANVWAGEEAWLIIAHLTVGALLWVVLVLVSFEALGVRQRSAAGAPRAARAEVAPA